MHLMSMKPCNDHSAHASHDWLQDLGLRPGWGWLADPRFGLALLAGCAYWLTLTGLTEPVPVLSGAALISLILLQPLLEELLFRGLLQGWLRARPWSRRQLGGFTLANMVVTLLFTALHFINHPPLWAAGVLLPSLLYGYFRDRHDSVLPAIALHVFYNAGYFLIPLVWKG
jgi:membrane protease YdiL (CAAX protease family)